MATKVWRGGVDFDAWTHIQSGAYDNRLTFGGLANSFTTASKLTSAGYASRRVSYFADGVCIAENTAPWRLVVTDSNMQNGTIRARTSVGTEIGGWPVAVTLSWRYQGTNNYYHFLNTNGNTYLRKVINNVGTTIASGAHAVHAPGVELTIYAKSSGNSHEAGETDPHAFTLAATDASLPGGGQWGLAGDSAVYGQSLFGVREDAAATTGIARSDTFDAGATTETADVLTVGGVSLNGGSGIVRVSAVNAAGAPSFTQTITLADGTDEYLFTTVTGRYWQLEASLPAGGSLAWIGFDKGNNAGAAAAAATAQTSYLGEGQNRYIH